MKLPDASFTALEWEKKNGYDPDEDWSKDKVNESYMKSTINKDFKSKKLNEIKSKLSESNLKVLKQLYNQKPFLTSLFYII